MEAVLEQRPVPPGLPHPAGVLCVRARVRRQGRRDHPRLAAVLAFPPVATGLAMWMPATEPLVRQEARLVAWGSYTALDAVHGPLFVAALAYSYLFVAVGLLQLVSTSLRAPLVYKQQSALVALGAVVPIGASVASYISGYTIIDLTPVALSAFGVAVAVALARYCC
ncbi:histidine kinase N-terminal 7TM domain-containing protein [Halobaculum litoreum]|uniref:Histidine kinase N-terminal 7TM domain-containing protein n=1 Tax=Halobaculum litoreum TaxID=3031998 RepID=A0ABD5XR36_9EURY